METPSMGGLIMMDDFEIWKILLMEFFGISPKREKEKKESIGQAMGIGIYLASGEINSKTKIYFCVSRDKG